MSKVFSKIVRKQPNFWSNIHFHPADAIEDPWGQTYLNEVFSNNAARTVRMYSMLEDIVTRDEQGALQYDFRENDCRMDYLIEKGADLLVCYCFFPPCIADPNQKFSDSDEKAGSRYKGKFITSEPPLDYREWEEICYQYTKHIVDRYGLDRVKNWYLQCYNEPEGSFLLRSLSNSPDAVSRKHAEYNKIYRSFAGGCSKVSTGLKLGGPAGFTSELVESFLKYASEENLKVDFLSVHSYGADPTGLNNKTIRYTPQNILNKIKNYAAIRDTYFPGLEIVVDEWGASCNGYHDITDCPALILRETSAYAAYYGRLIKMLSENGSLVSKLMICLSGSHQVHQMPGKFREFTGFRSFFTEHFIRKPIFNAYVLGNRLYENILESDEKDPHIDLFPTTDGKNIAVLLAYASEYYDEALPDKEDILEISLEPGKYQLTQWIIDRKHCAPYEMFLKEGFAEFPTEEEINALREESILKPAADEEITVDRNTLSLPYRLTDNALMLVELHRK